LNRVILREKNKRAITPGKEHFSIKQVCMLVKDLGDTATVLYGYYFRKATNPSFDIKNDKLTAYNLGWSLRKVQRTRWKLCNGGYILTRVFCHNDGDRTYVTVLGSKLVAEYCEEHQINVAAFVPSGLIFCEQCNLHLFPTCPKNCNIYNKTLRGDNEHIKMQRG